MFLHNLKSCKSHQTITLCILKTFDSCVSEFYGHPCFTNKTRKHPSRMRAARPLFTVPGVSVRRVSMTENLPGGETPWTGTPPGRNTERPSRRNMGRNRKWYHTETPPWPEWQTVLKILPCPKFRMWAVKMPLYIYFLFLKPIMLNSLVLLPLKWFLLSKQKQKKIHNKITKVISFHCCNDHCAQTLFTY